ncbi:OmpA family protein [Pseudomonas sp. UL073]|uniref:OmpA family protein n=1 Tax=Zestomonas insulae TaxID=2809017 RepID=A0ABS2IF62_9GAMM|nr:OmpA family protein [Pseudomonas insulae]MBM7060773.1 OmpA family protein [Pseudomonas insulae]
MLKSKRSTGQSLLVGCAMVMLAACGTTVSKVDSQGETDNPVFPPIEDANRADGTYVNLENLNKIHGGMTKRQLFELIGPPHFSEGLAGVHEWDYVLKFRQGFGQPDKVCQYKVLFDDGMLARSFFFKPESCLEPEPANEPRVKQIMLSADATFGFNSAELRSAGGRDLSRLADELDEMDLMAIDIEGHTDRFGSDAHNMALSWSRAKAVRSYLIEQGVPASVISIDGLGAAAPLVECPGKKSPAVIQCLAPNRRTTITIHTH